MSLPPDLARLLIALVIAASVLGFLRVVGYAYFNAVLWHNLKVEVHRLRIAQQRRLFELASGELDDRVVSSDPVAPTEVAAPAAGPAEEPHPAAA